MLIDGNPGVVYGRDYVNVDNSTQDQIDTVRYVAYGVIAPIIVSVGILGNLLTITILRLPRFRGVTYSYFTALALSDLLSLLFSISVLLHLLHQATIHYSTAVWYSYFETLLANTPMTISVFLVICITVERYFCVCRPTDFQWLHTARHARNAILTSVAAALTCWLPICFLKDPMEYQNCDTTTFQAPDNRTWYVACMSQETRYSPYYISYIWVRQTVITFIPVIILVLLNSLTIRRFWHVVKKRNELKKPVYESADDLTRNKEDQHLVTLLLAISISFFLTMMPAGIYNAIYTEIKASDLSFEIFRATANLLEILNHSLNFYLYVLCSAPIRDALRELYRKYRKEG